MLNNTERGKRIRIAIARRSYKKTTALAARLNVSVAAISRWQNGGQISLSSVCSLAEALDISLDWLLLGRGTFDWHKDDRVTQADIELITLVHALPPRAQKSLKEMLFSMANGH